MTKYKFFNVTFSLEDNKSNLGNHDQKISICQVLLDTTEKVQKGQTTGSIEDIDGNLVGRYWIDTREITED